MYSAKKPLVAIVGRPNVGKSTLFNRLVGRPISIVSDIAGTTRDRVSTETVWAEYPFILVDTGGLAERNDGTEATPTQIWEKVRSQIDVAIDDADIIVMVTDVGTGITPADHDVADGAPPGAQVRHRRRQQVRQREPRTAGLRLSTTSDSATRYPSAPTTTSASTI